MTIHKNNFEESALIDRCFGMSQRAIVQPEVAATQRRLVLLNSKFKTIVDEFEKSKAEDQSTRLSSMQRIWEEKAKIFDEYHECLEGLPKEVRSREFFKNLRQEFHGWQENFKNRFSEYRDYSVEDWQYLFAEKKIQFEQKWSELQDSMTVMQARLSELEQDPIVQKFLRGETVLSDIKSIQWARKLGHAAFGLTVLYLFVYSGWTPTVIWSLTMVFVVWAFTLETARHLNPKVNDWVCRAFKPVMREHEKTKVNSAIFYTVSLLTVNLIFPLPVTILSLLFLALGDPVASVVGLKYGRTKLFSHVSLEGSLACFSMAFVIAFLYAGYFFDVTISGVPLFFFSLLAGLTGAVSESLFPKLDDNLVIPLVSAPVLWILMHLFGLF